MVLMRAGKSFATESLAVMALLRWSCGPSRCWVSCARERVPLGLFFCP